MSISSLTVATKALTIVSPVLGSLVELLGQSVGESQEVGQSGNLDAIQHEARKQELMLLMAERQAKVAQELAIARRIETAEEVEMEEFYDTNAAASVGVKSNGSTVIAGVSAEGQRVTKRIFRFKGGTTKTPKSKRQQ